MKGNKYSKDFNKRMADLFRTQNGQELMSWLEEVYFNQLSYTRGDSHDTSFREGARDLVFDIKKRIENDGNNSG